MPIYEYSCQSCGKNFSVIMHIAEHGRERPTCPECKQTGAVQQQYTTFFAKTSKKS